MSTVVFTDAYVSLGGVDLSDHVKQVTLNYQADTPDGTAMGMNTKKSLPDGLLEWDMKVDFLQDYAAANVDATLFPLVGQTLAVVIRPVKTGGVSATNPNYSGTGVLKSYPPMSADVGGVGKTTANIVCNTALARATA